MRQSADENTSHQREDKDGDMLLCSKEEHGGRTFIRLHEGQVQEGPRWTMTKSQAHCTLQKQPNKLTSNFTSYCTSYSLFIITFIFSCLLKLFFDCIYSTKYNLCVQNVNILPYSGRFHPKSQLPLLNTK